MARCEIKSKNFFTEPIISAKVDRILVFVFSFLGTFAGIILKSVTDWSFAWIIFVVFVSALVLVFLLKAGHIIWIRSKA